MFVITLIILALAAIGGITMLTYALRRQQPPLWLATIHGILAVIGLILLVIVVTGILRTSTDMTSLIFFLWAVPGGALLLLAFHLRDRLLPRILALGHGGIAIVAFIILLIFVASSKA